MSKLKFIISNVSLNTLFMMDDKSYLIWRKCCTILCIVSFVIQNNQYYNDIFFDCFST